MKVQRGSILFRIIVLSYKQTYAQVVLLFINN